MQARAVRKLLAHRLSGESAEKAKAEWYEVVEGDHSLWQGVSDPYKHTIRAFLVYFHTQIQRHSTERFNFRNGSVGRSPTPSWNKFAIVHPASSYFCDSAETMPLKKAKRVGHPIVT